MLELVEEFKEAAGFVSYELIRKWLKALWDIEIFYMGIDQMFLYRLKAKLKVLIL